MKLPIVKWGHSAAVRLPVALLDQLGIATGDVLQADLTSEAGSLILRKLALRAAPDAAVAAIKFSLVTGDGPLFLHYWLHGDFEVIRRNWPDVPGDVFVGADSQNQPAPAGTED